MMPLQHFALQLGLFYFIGYIFKDNYLTIVGTSVHLSVLFSFSCKILLVHISQKNNYTQIKNLQPTWSGFLSSPNFTCI